MPTTFVPNPAGIIDWPLYAPGVTNGSDIVRAYFRQSADGVNFTVSTVYLQASDALAAAVASPQEWCLTSGGFPAWSHAANAGAVPGGLGRLIGASKTANG